MELKEILDIIDTSTAWAWIQHQTFTGGLPICPTCGTAIVGHRALMSFELLERTYCKTCKSNSPARAFIPALRGTEWQPEEFVKLLLLDAVGKSSADISALLGKSITCIRAMLDRLAVLALKSPTGNRALDG